MENRPNAKSVERFLADEIQFRRGTIICCLATKSKQVDSRSGMV